MLMRPKAGPQSRRRFTAAWLSFLRLMAFIPIKHRLSNMSVTILVVDDNPDILSNVRDFLEIKGWRVETATTAADAWERLSREGIDLLILDIGLPGMDGMTLCRRIRIAEKYRYAPAAFGGCPAHQSEKPFPPFRIYFLSKHPIKNLEAVPNAGTTSKDSKISRIP